MGRHRKSDGGMSREARENTALTLAERGEPHTVIATRLGVSAPTVSKLIKAAKARGARRPSSNATAIASSAADDATTERAIAGAVIAATLKGAP